MYLFCEISIRYKTTFNIHHTEGKQPKQHTKRYSENCIKYENEQKINIKYIPQSVYNQVDNLYLITTPLYSRIHHSWPRWVTFAIKTEYCFNFKLCTSEDGICIFSVTLFTNVYYCVLGAFHGYGTWRESISNIVDRIFCIMETLLLFYKRQVLLQSVNGKPMKFK